MDEIYWKFLDLLDEADRDRVGPRVSSGGGGVAELCGCSEPKLGEHVVYQGSIEGDPGLVWDVGDQEGLEIAFC